MATSLAVKPPTKPSCDRCQISDAKFKCETCQASLCEACNTLLHSLGKFAKHRVHQVQEVQSLEDDQKVDIEVLSHLELCQTHGLPFTHFNDSGSNEKTEDGGAV